MDVTHLTTLELLRAHGAILDELRRREIVRSTNSPISDYAEVLFCRAFGWTREGNSAAGFDATDVEGQRYQIKACRMGATHFLTKTLPEVAPRWPCTALPTTSTNAQKSLLIRLPQLGRSNFIWRIS